MKRKKKQKREKKSKEEKKDKETKLKVIISKKK